MRKIVYDKIRQSSDYSKFSFIETNRPLHVSKGLRESIENFGFIASSPIVVNPKGEILDGQNRFSICAELKTPFFYSVAHTRNREEDNALIIALNKNQRQWRLVEFIHHHAERGVKFHTAVKNFEEKHGLGMSNAILLCLTNSAMPTEHIRAGIDLRINPRRDECAAFIKDCSELHFHKRAHFVRAVKILHDKANAGQIKKLYKRHLAIPHQPSQAAYLTVFANIINKNNPNNRISF